MNKLLITAAALAATAGAAPAYAQATYDAFSSFNAQQGTGGFSYGSYDGTTFTPFTQSGGCAIGGTTCLQGSNSTVPGVYKTTGGAFTSGTVLVPADRLILHPGDGSVQTYALFTASTSGAYTFNATFTQQDTNPNSVLVTQFFRVSGANVFDLSSSQLGPFDEVSYGTANGAPLALLAGDSIGFLVNNDGDYRYDSTGFAFTLQGPSAVPEPATWGMMVLGFGLVGAGLRARAKVRMNVSFA